MDLGSLRTVAFDPGVNGGYSLWVAESLVSAVAIPEDDVSLLRSLVNFAPHVIVTEKVHSGPKQGPAAAFTFGRQYQRILSLSLSVVFEGCIFQMTPTQWQQSFGFVRPDNKPLTYSQKKSLTLKTAKLLYPDHKLVSATADAVLIGKFFTSAIGSPRSLAAVAMYSGIKRGNLNVG